MGRVQKSKASLTLESLALYIVRDGETTALSRFSKIIPRLFHFLVIDIFALVVRDDLLLFDRSLSVEAVVYLRILFRGFALRFAEEVHDAAYEAQDHIEADESEEEKDQYYLHNRSAFFGEEGAHQIPHDGDGKARDAEGDDKRQRDGE